MTSTNFGAVPFDKGDTLQLKKLGKDGLWEVVVNGLRTTTVLLVESPGAHLVAALQGNGSAASGADDLRTRSTSTNAHAHSTALTHASSVSSKDSKDSKDPALEPPRGLKRVMSGEISMVSPKSPRPTKEKRSKDKERKDKEKSKSKLTDNMSESTLKFALISPRSPRVSHPRLLDDDEKQELVEELDEVRAEITALHTELHLLVRGWREEFRVSDAMKVDPRLTPKLSPDDMMFERLLSTPYAPLNKPPTIPAAALQSLKTTATTGAPKADEKKEKEKEKEKEEKKEEKDEKKYRAPTKKDRKDKERDDKDKEKDKDKDKEKKEKEAEDESVERVENEIALAPRRRLRVVELLLPEFNLNAVSEEHLGKLDSLAFNVLGLQQTIEQEEQCEHYLHLLVMHMFHRLGLVEEFAIPEKALFRFVKTISRRYRNVPFHNFFHAFNVTQTMFYFLTTARCERMLGPLEKLSMMVATLCHDADHPGLNNGCLQQAQTKVAALHKKSTLENHHLLQGMQVLSMPECDILVNLSDDEIDRLQHYLRDLVLATDLSLHGIILRDIEARTKKIAKEWKKEHPKLDEGDLITLMCVIMKCSDLSNEIRPREIANMWAQRINKEFFAQADKERELNLKVSAWMDYTKIVLAKEQINFIGGLCMPLYRALLGVVPTVKVCVDQMENNKREWEGRLKNFYSIEEQKNTSDRSIWKEDEEKGTSFLATVARRVSGANPARIVRTSQQGKKPEPKK